MAIAAPCTVANFFNWENIEFLVGNYTFPKGILYIHSFVFLAVTHNTHVNVF